MSITTKCRACLAERGEMKNMYEWGLCEDFFKFTEVQVKRSEGLSELLCAICEDVLNKCISFRTQCMRSDLIMRDKQVVEIKKLQEKDCLRIVKDKEKIPQDVVNSVMRYNEITYNMSFPQINIKTRIPCSICKKIFTKPKALINHLKDDHLMNHTVLFHYYCPYLSCNYFIDSGKDKYFTERKYLNQHMNKVHAPRTLSCVNCKAAFPKDSDLHRHIKVCSQVFKCHECGISYSKKEPYLVHLMRRHPEAHKKYKEEKPLKRAAEAVKEVKEKSYDELVKGVSEFICCAPKKQRLAKVDDDDDPNDLIDMSFPNLDNLDSNSNLAEPVDSGNDIEELLAIKNQSSDTQFFFDEDLELEQPPRSESRTNFIKSLFDTETPTCTLINSETQTQFSPDLKQDVMLSFATAETQTYFDQELADSSMRDWD